MQDICSFLCFFLIVGLTIGISDLYQSDRKLDLKFPSIIIAITFVAILFYPTLFTRNSISLPVLLAELLISILVLFALNLRENAKCSLILIPILIFFQGSLLYHQENWISLSNTGNTYKDVVYNESRMSSLINYFYSNTDKVLIKYIDLTPEIEKPGGVPHNFPWFIRYQNNDMRRISSYMGYDQGLAQQLEYAQKFSYYTKYDKDYLMESGADYVIYNRPTQTKEMPWLTTIVDSKVPELDVGNGYFAAKILQEKTLNNENVLFDNGVFKVLSDDTNFKVTLFKTNWSTKTELDFVASKNGVVYFELFPHKNLKFYLNGVLVEPAYSKAGLACFNFSAGKNQLVVSYSNSPLTFFLLTYLFYILLVIGILIGYLWICIKKKYTKERNERRQNSITF